MSGRFRELWSRTIADGSADTVWSRLDALYRETGRAYHNWTHIEAMLAGLDGVRADAEFSGASFDEVELAVFFHDVIYVPGRSDNEALSAELLCVSAGPIPRIGERGIARIAALILATAKHAPSPDLSTRLLIDLDLAVLGGAPDDYRRYIAAVRQEYAAIPEDAWRTGRADVMRRFLQRHRLYQSDCFFDRLEAQARANIAAEVTWLEAG